MKYIVHRHRHRILLFSALTIVLLGLILGWRTFIGKGGEVASVNDQDIGQITGRPTPKFVSSRTLSFGSIYLGGTIDEQAKSSSKRFEYPFLPLEGFGRQEYDAWLANLTCPLTDNNITDANQENGTSNCSREYGTELEKWIDVVAIANNHLDDQGEDGFSKTKAVLDEKKVQYVGNYDPNKYEDMCEIVNLPARYTLNDGSFKEANMPLAVCSVNLSEAIPEDLAVDKINEYSKILPTWVYAHSTATQSEIDRQTYRSFINAGASVVMASQSSVSERVEAYEGKLIVYSLGGFIGSSLDADVRSFGIGIEISAELDQSILLWTRLSAECSVFDDACIETAKNQGLVLPKYSYKFTTVAIDRGDDLAPTRSSQKDNEVFQSSIGWESTIANLSY